MPNIWSKKAYVQIFDCEYITFKAYINMFERMEIAESIYKGEVETSHKIPTREDSNRSGHSNKMRIEVALSNTYSKFSESAGKQRKQYVDHPKDISKPTCIIHGSGHS